MPLLAESAFVDQRLIDLLEDWLVSARSGELRGIAIVGLVSKEREYRYAWSGDVRLTEAIGMTELLKQNIWRDAQEDGA